MKIEYKKIDELMLDPNNDRFAELYSGSGREEDLIEYLLYTEAAEEIAKNISERGQFYADAALWIIPHKNGFLVKDGNRRCAAMKALQNPKKYNLNLPKININELPVLIYTDEAELDRRIQEQHAHSLFREWERIAKALKAFEMHNSGFSEEAMKEIDSTPSQLIKLASFYYEAVKISGEELKMLLRRGKGDRGGKTIIFERLFSFHSLCGYKFNGKPSYEIRILDKIKFEGYINALVSYLKDFPSITHKIIDDEKSSFFDRLRDYNFVAEESDKKSYRKNKSNTEETNNLEQTKVSTKASTGRKGSVRNRPLFERKQVAPKLRRLIDECYKLDNGSFSNAKVALSRVVFEAVLKYVIEETDYNGKTLRNYAYFRQAFYDKHGKPRTFTDFSVLRQKFIDLIKVVGDKNAFKQFDPDRLNQVIHNYKVGASPQEARIAGENLCPLIEFMLKRDNDLFGCLELGKLT